MMIRQQMQADKELLWLIVRIRKKDGCVMGNHMDLDYEMFCYQCEQTANGKGCTRQGVCGKTPQIAGLQDLLLFQLKGISVYGKQLLDAHQAVEEPVIRFIENGLFTTLTNVNFDEKVHVELLRESQRIKEKLREQAGEAKKPVPQTTYTLPETETDMWFLPR